MSTKRILIVDDDAFFTRALSIKLRGEGYDVVTAEDGAGAVGALRLGKPDLILLDIVFPPDVAHGGGVAWDGFLIMDWLRRMCDTGGTPVILVSAGDPAQYLERARKAGAAGFLQKGAESGALLGAIQQLLGEPKTVAC